MPKLTGTNGTGEYKVNISPETSLTVPTIRKPKEAFAEITPTQINAFFNHLMGELLTIVEATTTDNVQRKAIKSVVGNKIHNESIILQQWIISTSEGMGSPFPYLY